MGNIVLLDDLTINKIAAGEVIERPASVVKEVVENSIDAGADNISIEIKNGGISYIRITDNGKGIAEDDLEIAFERHATSKIRKAEDLETVKSMGFRGEALASIAAISRVELVTRTEESEIGHRIVVEGGKIILKEETGCAKGTSITIENLFYNTPVRYKFLKKDFTESGYIEDAITRIALVNPNIAIKLINSGKTVIQTSGNGDIKDIIYGVYGKDIAENIINVEYYFEDMAVKGVIGKPSVARSNRSNQLFFVNKRFVKDKTLTSAAEQAFKGLLPIGKYGFLILNIEIDPHKLDVNVHPAKLEVRFQEENKIFKLVYHAIKEALLKLNVDNQNENESSGESEDNYINEIEKIESKLFEDNSPQTSESKGFGGFLKNILGGSKNEFSTNKENLVEQLYKDKLQHEQEDIIKTIKSINSDSTESSDINGLDGNIESQSSNLNNDNNEDKNDETKPTSNLERLIKELDANLESLQNSIKMNDRSSTTIEDEQNSENKTEQVNNNNEFKVDNNFENVSSANGDENSNVNEEKTLENNKEEDKEIVENQKNDNTIETIEKTENIKNSEETNISKEQKTTEVKPQENDAQFEEMYAKMFGTTIPNRNKVEDEKDETYSVKQDDLKTVENFSLFTTDTYYNRPVYKYIGIVFGQYIVIEYEREMYIVNQRIAQEKILYEKLKQNYLSETEKDSQLMLLPDIITLTDKEIGIAKDNMDLLKKAGFDVEEFGDKTVRLSGVPSICIDLDTRQLFLEILNEINTVARTAKQEIEEKLITTVACKVAKKTKLALTEQEVDTLMQQLLSLPQPFESPSGNPTAVRMSKFDIEKKFSRR